MPYRLVMVSSQFVPSSKHIAYIGTRQPTGTTISLYLYYWTIITSKPYTDARIYLWTVDDASKLMLSLILDKFLLCLQKHPL